MKNRLNSLLMQPIRQSRPTRVLNAMVRPEDLLMARHQNLLPHLLPMARRKTNVVRRMPIERGQNMLKFRDQAIDHRHDCIGARHTERAARHKIVLHIGNDQCFHFLNL